MPVQITRGSSAGSFGYIQNSYFDGCAMYTIKIPGSGPQHPMDYIMDEIPDHYVHVPAHNCAIYHSVGSYVRVKSGGWAGNYGPVTACTYDADEGQYDVTIRVSADQFPAYPTDYLPTDQEATFPGHMLA